MNLHPPRVEGLVLVGDSIAVGLDTLAGKIPARPFGLWIAQAVGISFTSYATGGYTIERCTTELLPRVQSDYRIGCLAAGTNDALNSQVGSPEALVAGLAAHAQLTVVLGVNASLRGAGPVNVGLEAAARNAGAVFVPVDLPARLLRPDGVHPSAAGQLVLADLVADALNLGLVPSATIYPKGPPSLPLLHRVAWRAARLRR